MSAAEIATVVEGWATVAGFLRDGVTQFGSTLVFDADWDALNATGEQVKQARTLAS